MAVCDIIISMNLSQAPCFIAEIFYLCFDMLTAHKSSTFASVRYTSLELENLLN